MAYALVYASTAAHSPTRAELVELLDRSRPNNATLDITGILLYREGHYLQVLEGPEMALQGLYKRITADPRHSNVEPVWVSTNDKRRFLDWSMGFRDLDEEPIDHPGFDDVLRVQADAVELLRDPDQLNYLLRVLEPAW